MVFFRIHPKIFIFFHLSNRSQISKYFPGFLGFSVLLMAKGIFSGRLHLYGSSYPEKSCWIPHFFWAQLAAAELWVRLGGYQDAALCIPVPSVSKILNSNANLSRYTLKPERSTFPKPAAICLIMYLFYLCFHTSPASCLMSYLEKWSPGWLQRLWTTRNY